VVGKLKRKLNQDKLILAFPVTILWLRSNQR
jgi:hypothetical protein